MMAECHRSAGEYPDAADPEIDETYVYNIIIIIVFYFQNTVITKNKHKNNSRSVRPYSAALVTV